LEVIEPEKLEELEFPSYLNPFNFYDYVAPKLALKDENDKERS
jgi:hypothetical protein